MKRYICSRAEKFNIAHIHSLLAGFLFFREILEEKKLTEKFIWKCKELTSSQNKEKKKTAVANLYHSISRQFGTCINTTHRDQWKKAEESRNKLNKNAICKEENEYRSSTSHHMQILTS